ncbi:hypothetical protein ASE23_27980 [Rhizobium sp. Root73]|uniref:hypothetical protein n=1 Tax=unclassified Rhizobium TaxID=2613769 RepID=UPI00072C40E5|nr:MULTISPECIES: hypothetical protein [unclassified Rhizobium]KQY12471.1 hypothetical protein ASD36_27930 [Rhizobium sp. Root1334]KRC04484.1 hypothetical protein ASE23_27980 [Rhizobium sp. Root73]
MWLELTSDTDEKIYVNVNQLIVIYPADEHKLTRILTSGGPITIKEPMAFLQSKLEGATGKQ